MVNFDKDKIKEQLSIDQIYDLCQEFGGEPQYSNFGFISTTICHNMPGYGSRKLYFYENSGLFRCYTGCDSTFDIFELVIKVMKIQHNEDFDLNDAIRYVAYRFGISGEAMLEELDKLQDWKIFENYERINNIMVKTSTNLTLKNFDESILDNLNYNIKLTPWLNEGISQEVLDKARIGYFLGGDQITIPHYDKDGKFIGLRGRSVCKEECEIYGKYRPVVINKVLYNHPLGMNLYNLNNSKDNIKTIKKAIVFEGEKSALKYQTMFGFESDISCACCGSNITSYQMSLLMEAGAEEIIIAFDRQFQEKGDSEYIHLKTNLLKIYDKFKNYVNVTFIFDKNMITDYKSSPIDHGKDIFLQLFKERVVL